MNITIDVTDSPSLYIQIKKNNKIMHLEIFKDDEIVYNIFENKNVIQSNYGNLKGIVNELKEFLNAD